MWWQLIFFYFHPYLGRFPIWWAYFSNGLVQPPSRSVHGSVMGYGRWFTFSHLWKDWKQNRKTVVEASGSEITLGSTAQGRAVGTRQMYHPRADGQMGFIAFTPRKMSPWKETILKGNESSWDMLVFRENPTMNEDVSPVWNYVGDFRYSVVMSVFRGWVIKPYCAVLKWMTKWTAWIIIFPTQGRANEQQGGGWAPTRLLRETNKIALLKIYCFWFHQAGLWLEWSDNINTHRIHGTGIFTYMNGWILW